MNAGAQPAATPDAGAAPPRFRAAIEYAVSGDTRFLSHRDELRCLARAMTRAGWPVKYSSGFNPQPRLSVVLPRSVGTASDCQLAVVELTEPCDAKSLHQALSAQLPPGLTLHRVLAPATDATPHAVAVRYEVSLLPQDRAKAEAAAAELLESEDRAVLRRTRARPAGAALRLREHVERAIVAGGALSLTLRMHKQRTVRPTEIIAELGLESDQYAHRVRRTQVEWDISPDAPTARRKPQEGNSSGHEESNAKDSDPS